MPELVPMPKLGFDMAEGTLVRKVKKEGETVRKGEVLAEIETDKATVEVEAYVSGVVRGWLVDEGQKVPVGTHMAVIAAPDEKVDMAALRQQAGAAPSAPAAAPAPGPAAPAEAAAPKPAAAPAAVAEAPAGPTPASPLARRMADEAGVDIGQIRGSGPGGRVTKKDVEAYLQSGRAPAAATPAAVTPAVLGAVPEDSTVPLTRLRQIIARRMTESKQTVPQFYVTIDVDMASAMELRRQFNNVYTDERKASVNDLIIKATALALRAFPNLNASFAGDKVVRKGHVNVGVAVPTPGGLLTVVVRDADRKPLTQIAAEAKAMIGRAREGKVQAADIEGSTFSISNLGMYDVDHFVAIINQPEAGILATGAVHTAPVVKDGAIVPGVRMKATLSADHRVTDGLEATQFLLAIKLNLEEPARLLL